MAQELVNRVVFRKHARSIQVSHRSNQQESYAKTEYVLKGQTYQSARYALYLDFMNGVLEWESGSNHSFCEAIAIAQKVKQNWISRLKRFDFLYESDFETQVNRILYDTVVTGENQSLDVLEAKELISELLEKMTEYSKTFDEQLKKDGKLRVEDFGDSIFEGYCACSKPNDREMILAPVEQVSPNGILWLSPEVLFLGKNTNKLIFLFTNTSNSGKKRNQMLYDESPWRLEKFEEICQEKLSHLKLKTLPYTDFLLKGE